MAGMVPMADADQPPVEPALARVTIFEVAERPWGWLTTSAEVDTRVYVGSREWRAMQSALQAAQNGHNLNIGPIGPITGPIPGNCHILRTRMRLAKRLRRPAPDPPAGSRGVHRIRFPISDFKK